MSSGSNCQRHRRNYETSGICNNKQPNVITKENGNSNDELSDSSDELMPPYNIREKEINRRSPMHIIKGPWTKREDEALKKLIKKYGAQRWSFISAILGSRLGKQCRERWHNHLNPEINKEPFSPEEDRKIYRLHQRFGNKWSLISKYLKGRTDNSIKNHWNSTISKRLMRESDKTLLDLIGSPSSSDQLDADTMSNHDNSDNHNHEKHKQCTELPVEKKQLKPQKTKSGEISAILPNKKNDTECLSQTSINNLEYESRMGLSRLYTAAVALSLAKDQRQMVWQGSNPAHCENVLNGAIPNDAFQQQPKPIFNKNHDMQFLKTNVRMPMVQISNNCSDCFSIDNISRRDMYDNEKTESDIINLKRSHS